MTTRIAIVGGGIAGLTLAALLDPRRFDVTIHEERPERVGLGTALGMWPAARRVLEAVGAQALLAEATSPGGGALRLLDGTPCLRASDAVDLVLVARTDLVRTLDAVVPTGVRRITGRVDDPAALDADLVVAADGVHSAVRRAVWGAEAVARVTPYLAVRGLVAPRSGDVVGEYWGRESLFGITPVPGERTNWFCAYRSVLGPRDVDVAEGLADARRRFEGAAPAVRSVLAEAEIGATLAGRIWTAPPLRSYVRGRVVLVGDAAHAMAPNLGRGACESIVDAGVLAEALTTLPIPDALRSYDMRRVVPSQAARIGSRLIADLVTSRRWARRRESLLRAAARHVKR